MLKGYQYSFSDCFHDFTDCGITQIWFGWLIGLDCYVDTLNFALAIVMGTGP
jgi:hypothetical protein